VGREHRPKALDVRQLSARHVVQYFEAGLSGDALGLNALAHLVSAIAALVRAGDGQRSGPVQSGDALSREGLACSEHWRINECQWSELERQAAEPGDRKRNQHRT